MVKESDPDDMEAGVTVMIAYNEIVQGSSVSACAACAVLNHHTITF